MLENAMEKSYLVLENGKIFPGIGFGAVGQVAGELVFTTSTVGYLETLTDPCCYGQLVLQTFPSIGNYGVIPADFQSNRPYPKGYIVREWCQEPSNFRSEGDLDAFLRTHNVVGICGVDTRALTRIIRDSGTIRAMITPTLENLEQQIESMNVSDKSGPDDPRPVDAVTAGEPYALSHGAEGPHVAVLDLGVKKRVLSELTDRGCRVTVFPARTSAAHIVAREPDGILISNGPGEPEEYGDIEEQIKKLMAAGIPLLGISLGHLLMAAAGGGKSKALPFGHRGENQPVKETDGDRVYITVQHHGHTVDPDALPHDARVTFTNINDGSVEGLAYKDRPVFSVQFFPEGAAGPDDTTFIFDRFIDMMKGAQTKCR